jgi:Xaa-Pro aminopeptidase
MFELRDWAPEERALIFVFLRQGEPFVVFRNTKFKTPYYQPLQAIKDIYPCHLILDEKSKVLVRQLKKRGFQSGRIGIELDMMPVRTYGYLQKAFPRAAFCDVSAFSRSLRVIKDEHQIACVQKAPHATEKGVIAMFRNILNVFPKKGWVSSWELERIFRKTLLEDDAQVYDEEVGMDDRQLKRGDYTIFDRVARYNGLLSDFCLGIYLGQRLPPELQQQHDRALAIIDTLAPVLRPGMTIGEAEGVSDKSLKKAFGNSYVREEIAERWVVHGIGIAIHDEPRFGRDYRGDSRKDARRTIRLEPGVVIVIEICGFGEEVFLMTKNGLQKMHHLRTGIYTLPQMKETMELTNLNL